MRKGGRVGLATGVLALAGLGAAAVWTLSALRAQAATPGRDGSAEAGGRPAPAAAGVFSAYIEDLPVMPGLIEQGSGFSFEMHQGGRLAQARLAGAQDPERVRGFYASTLPSLGWRASTAEPFVYRRGRERLVLVIEPAPVGRAPRSASTPRQDLEAVFVLSPAPASALDAQERRT